MARLAGACTIAFVASVLSYGPASAGAVPSHLKIKGDAATATFISVDPSDPCIETAVNIIVSEDTTKISPGEKSTTDAVELIVTQVNTCTGFPIFVGEGGTDFNGFDLDFDFEIAGNLSSATVIATVPVIDQESIVHPFEVDLTWTATGRPVRTHFHEQFRDREAGIFINSQVRGWLAPAVATGTVVGLGEDWTPEPSTNAELIKESAGIVTIERSSR